MTDEFDDNDEEEPEDSCDSDEDFRSEILESINSIKVLIWILLGLVICIIFFK